MGTFSVEATVANLADPTMRATLGLLVDTGATWTTLPGDVAADIGAPNSACVECVSPTAVSRSGRRRPFTSLSRVMKDRPSGLVPATGYLTALAV